MRKISSVIMACAMCLSMTVVGSVAPQVAVQAEETAVVEKKDAPAETPKYDDNFGYDCKLVYQGNVSEWISAIDKVEVNGEEYTKGSSSYSVWNNTSYYVSASQNYVLVGEAKFNEDTSVINKIVISAKGYKDLVLEVNKAGKTVAIHTNHTGGTATCIKKAVCDFCGEEYGDLAAHNYGDTYKYDGEYHWKVCQTEGCGATTEKEAHQGGTATTTEKAKCDVCGAEYGDLKKEDPKPADKTTESKADTKPADKTTESKGDTKPADKTTESKGDTKPADKTTESKGDTKPADKTTESKGDTKPADKTTSAKNNTKPAVKPAKKKTVKVKKIVITKKKIVLKKGKKAKIKVKLQPVKATEKVMFTSSNKKIAKVTKSGVVKAVKKGKCKITVKSASGKKAIVKVTVK